MWTIETKCDSNKNIGTDGYFKKKKKKKSIIDTSNENSGEKLKWLTVRNFGIEGARMLSESLKTNITLTDLGLHGDEKNEVKWYKW